MDTVDPLAADAAKVLVEVLVKEGTEALKKLPALWRSMRDRRRVRRQLRESANALHGVSPAGNAIAARETYAWQVRIAALLADCPDRMPMLQAILAELRDSSASTSMLHSEIDLGGARGVQVNQAPFNTQFNTFNN